MNKRKVFGLPIPLLVIILLAVILRLGLAFYLGNDLNDLQQERVYDQISYDGLAQRVLSGHGFSMGTDWWPLTRANEPTAHWSFLYTLYIAAVYAVWGPHPLIARIIQGIMTGILIPVLTYQLSRQAFNATVGIVAAGISAVYAYFIFYSVSLMTETFFILAILSSLYLAGMIHKAEKPAVKLWLLLGLSMGAAVLLRQTFLLVIVLIGVWLIYAAEGRRQAYLKGFALSGAIVVLLVLPWSIRNYLAFDQWVLLNTNAGYAFFWANHPIHGTNFMTLLPKEVPYTSLIPEKLTGLNEAAMESALMKIAVQTVLADPVRYLLLSLNRLKDQFIFWPVPGSSTLANISRVFSFGIFFPFMLYGIGLSIFGVKGGMRDNFSSHKENFFQRLADRLKTPGALWIGFIGLYNLLHLASWAATRYRLPTDAVMIIFAAFGIVELYNHFALRSARRTIAKISV